MAFTPDEEGGQRGEAFRCCRFDACWAYTVDGGGVGELEFENFNAASVTIKIVGNNVHPGTGERGDGQRGRWRRAFMPKSQRTKRWKPPKASEGFVPSGQHQSTVDRADMHYIIRDFDRKQFEARKRKMMEIAKKRSARGCIRIAILSWSSKTAITIA